MEYNTIKHVVVYKLSLHETQKNCMVSAMHEHDNH